MKKLIITQISKLLNKYYKKVPIFDQNIKVLSDIDLDHEGFWRIKIYQFKRRRRCEYKNYIYKPIQKIYGEIDLNIGKNRSFYVNFLLL